jgi:hypothetical protein
VSATDGEVVFRHACKLGLEGIVSKRLGSRYPQLRTLVGAAGTAGSRQLRTPIAYALCGEVPQ